MTKVGPSAADSVVTFCNFQRKSNSAQIGNQCTYRQIQTRASAHTHTHTHIYIRGLEL